MPFNLHVNLSIFSLQHEYLLKISPLQSTHFKKILQLFLLGAFAHHVTGAEAIREDVLSEVSYVTAISRNFRTLGNPHCITLNRISEINLLYPRKT